MKPLIGLSTYGEPASWGVWRDVPVALVPQGYVDGLVTAGAIPVLLPPSGGPDEAAAALARLDGLLLVGGADIDPVRYGRPVHPKTTGIRSQRDGWEAALTRAALDADLPVLGVCRGAQLLNVVLGGTLDQHLPETVGHEVHRPEPAVFGRNAITLDPAGQPGLALGPQTTGACYHHQAIATLGRGVVPAGWHADGTIEAIRVPERAFVVGVQWHPEMDGEDARLWRVFVDAARVRASASRVAVS